MKNTEHRIQNTEARSQITDHRSRINEDAGQRPAPSVVGSAHFPGTMGGGRPRPPGGRDGRPPVFFSRLRGENPSSFSVSSATSVAKNRRGFTLIEIMFAIAILGVGLIMVAATFPIAIKWTTQDAQKTIGQTIAQSAVAYLTNVYGPATANAPPSATAWTAVGSASMATYQLNSTVPYSSTLGGTSGNPYALYSWTAVIRLDPISFADPAAIPTWDVYIFVFNQGDSKSTYGGGSSPTPTLSIATVSGMPIGTTGVDLTTGGVVRTIINANGQYAVTGLTTSAQTPPNDSIIYAPPATGPSPQTASPTVYIYATTLKF